MNLIKLILQTEFTETQGLYRVLILKVVTNVLHVLHIFRLQDVVAKL